MDTDLGNLGYELINSNLALHIQVDGLFQWLYTWIAGNNWFEWG